MNSQCRKLFIPQPEIAFEIAFECTCYFNLCVKAFVLVKSIDVW